MSPEVATSLTDKQIFLILALFLMVIQFIYRLWDKKDTKQTIDAINKNRDDILNTIKATLDALNPHIERSRKTLGIVQDLKHMHDIRDEDGRFIWYMPKEIIETQRELAAMTHTVATTQKHMAKILQAHEARAAEQAKEIKLQLQTHQESCKNQFHELKDNIK